MTDRPYFSDLPSTINAVPFVFFGQNTFLRLHNPPLFGRLHTTTIGFRIVVIFKNTIDLFGFTKTLNMSPGRTEAYKTFFRKLLIQMALKTFSWAQLEEQS